MSTHPSEIDKYEIIRHLGSGHFGNVYLSNDRALDQIKAIKVLDVPDPNNFMKELEEAQILNKCRHKHIVEVNEANLYDVNSKLSVIIDMEYIEGGSLESLMENQFISVINGVEIVRDVLFGLEHAHTQGILHRDIKPANIMLGKNTAKLSDFGLATSMNQGKAGSPRGYITHLAPEYFTNATTSIVTDIFAVGITLYRVVCNISDWRALIGTLPNPRYVIQRGKLISMLGYPPHVPSQIRRIINKACHINPSQRYKSASDMRKAIDKLRPGIKWNFVNSQKWEGSCCHTRTTHEISIETKRTGHHVITKKNGRKVTAECKFFSQQNEAENYLHDVVSGSAYK